MHFASYAHLRCLFLFIIFAWEMRRDSRQNIDRYKCDWPFPFLSASDNYWSTATSKCCDFFFHLIICIRLFVMIAMKYKIDSNHLLFHLHFQFMKIACANKSTNILNVCLSRLLYFVRLRRFSSYFMPLIISGNGRVKWQHGINQQMKPTILFSPHARE